MNKPKLCPPYFQKTGTWLKKSLALLSTCLLAAATHAQCITTVQSGTSFNNNAATGTLAFVNNNNAAKADQTFARSGALLGIGETKTQYLQATGFGFTIPPAATICHVSVDIQKRATGFISSNLVRTTYITDNSVKLVKKGVVEGNNVATATLWPNTAVTETYTGGTAYWNTTLTPADINDPQFGVAISARISTLAELTPRAEIDYIGIKVAYKINTPLPLILERFGLQETQNTITCNWTMAEEEEGGLIILQVNIQDQNWKDVVVYHQLANARNKSYSYSYPLRQNGNYQFRLKLVDANGKTTYSPVRGWAYGGNAGIQVYPSPATSEVYVSGVTADARVVVTNAHNQVIRVSQSGMDHETIRLHIEHLPKGMYFISCGTQTKKFLKY